MVPISFRAIVLGLLFVLQGLGDPFTHAHQGKNLNANSVAATRAEKSSVFRGRKVAVDREMREEVKKGEQDRQNTEISGATHPAAGKWDEGKGINLEVNQSNGMDASASEKTLRRSQPRPDDQNNVVSVRLKSGKSKAVWAKEGMQYPSSTGEPATSQELHKRESQRVLKAAHDMVSMLHKDYTDKPHRRPPINN